MRTSQVIVFLAVILLSCKKEEPTASLREVFNEICYYFEIDGFLPYLQEALKSLKFDSKTCKRCQDVKLNFSSFCKSQSKKGAIAPYPHPSVVKLAEMLKTKISGYPDYYAALGHFLKSITQGMPSTSAIANYCEILMEVFRPSDEEEL